MSTIIAFLLTLTQLAIAGYGYFGHSEIIFQAMVVYGSPLYFIMHLVGGSSVVFEPNIVYPLMAVGHVVKYLALFRSQAMQERLALHYSAVAMEIFYLALSAYYVL